MAQPRGKVIEVDFAARRRALAGTAQPAIARRLVRAKDVLLFWKPPKGRGTGEYLGGRWDWGWTLFIWTTEKAVGPLLADLVGDRGYVPQRFARVDFLQFLDRATDVGGLLIDGELEDRGQVIRAEPDQMIRREQAISALAAAGPR